MTATRKRRYWKLLLAGLLLYVGYVLAGVGLIAAGRFSKFYFLPGWAVKGPHADASGVSADGPVVYWQRGAWLSRQLVPAGKGLTICTDTLRGDGTDTVQCYAAGTGEQFGVPLRTAATVPAATGPLPERLLAVSDIEGNFRGFAALLRGAGVVDERLRWRFGHGHLVLVGDFFDRGLNVTECLWLVYKLEQEAARAGGQVHFIMGNHERMNLTGHYKYLRRKYRANADTLELPYARWYGRSTVLGQWLRSKNVVEKLGPVVFVHGGISPELAARHLPLLQLNDLARASLDTPVTALSPLARQATQPPGSPDWYRGLVQKEPTAAQVAQVLAAYGATTLVVGHTPVAAITPLYGGRVLAIDLPHQERTDAGQPLQALRWQGGRWQVVNSQGRVQPLAEE